MDDSRPDILEKILRRKHEEIAERSKTVSMDELKMQAAQADPETCGKFLCDRLAGSQLTQKVSFAAADDIAIVNC